MTKEQIIEVLNNWEFGATLKTGEFIRGVRKEYFDKIAEEIVKNNVALADVVRSVFTIHSTEDEGIIKITGTEEEAKKQVEEFKKQHSYADFFYEKQDVS